MLIDITYPLTNWGWTSSSCSTKWLFMSSDGSGSRRLATSIKIQTFELHSTWVFTGKLSPALLHMSKACNHYVLLSFLMVNLTNWQQVEPRAIGKWFHGKVCKILMTFLWSIRVQTKENCCWFGFFFFFFAITLISWCAFPLKFPGKSHAREREQQTAPPSYHYHAQTLINPMALDQSVCEKSFSYGKNRCWRPKWNSE